MSSRDDILASIRANLPTRGPAAAERSAVRRRPAGIAPCSLSRTVCTRMGGVFLDPAGLRRHAGAGPGEDRGAKVVCSTVPEIAGNRDIAGVAAPADLADVDFAMVRASFARRRDRLGAAERLRICVSMRSPISRST